MDEALTRLGRRRSGGRPTDSELRYFAGLSIEEAAEMLGISPFNRLRHWSYARLVALRTSWSRQSDRTRDSPDFFSVTDRTAESAL